MNKSLAETLEKISETEYTFHSKSGKDYDLKVTKSGVRCNCTGFKFYGKCRHIPLVPFTAKKRFPSKAADEVVKNLKKYFPKAARYEVAGSYRRGRANIGDVDILVESDSLNKFSENIRKNKQIEVTVAGDDIVRGLVQTSYGKVEFDVLRVNHTEWATYLLYRTGPKDLNVSMRKKAKVLGYKLNEHGLFRIGGEQMATNTEADVFRLLHMENLTPQEREDIYS